MDVPRLAGISAPVVTFFGSARPDPADPEYSLAYELGRRIAGAGYRLCNGGYGGTMEASARGASEAVPPPADGEPRTIGVTCTIFGERSVNRWIDREVATKSLMERLLTLISYGDAFVVVRGGTGTLLELAAVWELTNKQMIERKPIVVVGEFWDPVVERVTEQVIREGMPATIFRAAAPGDCIEILHAQLKGKSHGP